MTGSSSFAGSGDCNVQRSDPCDFPVISCYLQAICPFHVDFLIDFGFTPPPFTGIYRDQAVRGRPVANARGPTPMTRVVWFVISLTRILRSRRFASVFIASFGLLLIAGTAYPQADFPNRRIHVIVPYPAGGIVDIATRIVADRLSEIWRQPIVIETKPGANGNLGWDQVSRAAPEGYTWAFVGPALMTNPRMYANLRYSEKSFTPAGAVA
jgi:hypothetical protein